MIAMVVVVFPLIPFPVTMTVVVPIPMPANNNRCLGDYYRGRCADIDVHVDGVRSAGYANSKARD